jgi:excisionase family DNA binding protein
VTLRETFAPELVIALEELVDERVRVTLEQHGNGTSDSPWLTLDEGADYMRTSRRTLERLIKRGSIRSASFARSRLVHRDELDAYLRATTGEDVAPTTPPRRRRPSLERVSPEA